MSLRARRRVALAGLAAVLAALAGAVGWFGTAGADGNGELVVQASLGAPASVFLGASPLEAPGEVWATATSGRTLARYTDAGGWEALPEPVAAAGGPLAGLTIPFGASIGRTTPRGGVVFAAGAEEEEEEREILVVRDPGGALRAASDPTTLLGPGEALFGVAAAGRLLAATDEADGTTGAFLAPEGLDRVLAYDGSEWSEEPICLEASPGCTAPEGGFEALAIEAGGGEAWLLGRGGAPEAGLELFRRQGSGSPVWRQQPLGPAGSLGARFGQEEPLPGVAVAARTKGQPLTVTEKGVWVDATLTDGSGAEDATVYYDIAKGELTGSWCDLAAPAGLCTFPLGSELPSGEGRSFAWPPSGSSGEFGTRAITGVGEGGILSLEGSAFRRLTFVGGSAGAANGAALSSPEEGWLGATPPLQLTRNPEPARLQSWPVPFKKPLTAIAPEPGAPVGSIDAGALAVGDEGQVARYVPGLGWEPEFLLRGSGKRATPTLRGVAWPEPGRAYAVGDGAAMWMWQKATGLWQPDPTAPRSLVRANFTGIAFDPNRPSRGYAVGKQGVLLGFGRQWTQEALPPGVPAEANFTSIAFAGSEALATYKYPENHSGLSVYSGGLIVNDGSGWRVDEGAHAALAGAVPQRVAGLPDGGAVIASLGALEAGNPRGAVITRQGPGAPWQLAPGGTIGYPAALAAVREGSQVRAIASVVTSGSATPATSELNADKEQIFNQPVAGQAPLLTDPNLLPGSGVVVRQTATGWRDDQHQSYPLPPPRAGQRLYDLPVRPDPVLALLIAPDGSGGWAVGGETGTSVRYRGATIKTAGVMRYGAAATPPANAAPAPIPTEPEAATFAIGGNAQCAAACADFAGAGLGPDRWLRAAVGRAAAVPGMRGFIYAGSSVAAGEEVPLAQTLSPAAFGREEAAYARRLSSAAGALPVFTAPAQSDLDGAESLTTFSTAFAGFGAPLGSAGPGPGIAPVSPTAPGHNYYSFDSSGTSGTVRAIVLDYSFASLGDPQRCWLAQQLSSARAAGTPAIVVGERDLAGLAPNAADDRAQTIQALVGGGAPECALPGPAGAASAYFFNFPEENRAYRLSSGASSVPAYGSGTLGYVTPPAPTETDFAGASGFFVVSVATAQRDASTNVAPVSVRLTPSIGSLALDATDGTLLRRSQPALFEALARRPLAGSRCEGSTGAPGECELLSPQPYLPIPSECQGANCASSVFPEYTFTSSEPDVADFVSPDPASLNPRNVLLVQGKPVLDSHSGLICAFNAGTTTVTIATGGLSYSQKVTVQAGSVQRPCGTTPLRNRVAAAPAVAPPPAPAPSPTPTTTEPTPSLPPPPPPPLVPPAPPAATTPPPAQHPVPPPTPIPFPAPTPAQAATPLVPIVPPPPLPAVQPTPPSGTSQVNATEREEEEEEAYDMVSSMVAHPAPGPARVGLATAGSPTGGHGGVPGLVPALVLIAALAAAGVGGRRRQRPQLAYQSNNTTRRYR